MVGLGAFGRWSEGLRRSAKNFFEFAAEVRFIGEFQLTGSGLVRIALGNQLFSKAALEFAQPMAGSAMQMLTEQPLQLAL